MRDLIGRTLGHSRIVDKIGERGMGSSSARALVQLDWAEAASVVTAESRDTFGGAHSHGTYEILN